MSNKHLNRRPIPPAYSYEVTLRVGEIWQTRNQRMWANVVAVRAGRDTAFVNYFWSKEAAFHTHLNSTQEVCARETNGVFKNRSDPTLDLINRIWSPSVP